MYLIVAFIITWSPPAQRLQAEDGLLNWNELWPQRSLFRGQSAMEGDRISTYFLFKATDSRWNRKPISLVSYIDDS